jgi:DNA repair photolyase
LDFETRIVVKRRAAELLRAKLGEKSWAAEPIVFSGVTDCYQPAERQFRLTRQCLEVAVECRQPIGMITKNALVLRDLDLLQDLAADRLVHVFVSLTTLDPALARGMEPRTSIPAARLRAIERLANAGVPVGVMTAPVIPGLNETEVPELLAAAKSAGATAAGYTLLRLPLTVEPVFVEWLQRTQPGKADKVLQRIRQTRDGQLSSSQFKERCSCCSGRSRDWRPNCPTSTATPFVRRGRKMGSCGCFERQANQARWKSRLVGFSEND